MEIYVGNLSYGTSEDGLNELFANHGAVRQVKIITDRDSGRSRGFAFVSMDNDQEAQAAIDAINGHEFDGRALVVNQSRERKPREGGGGVISTVAVEIVVEAAVTTPIVVEETVEATTEVAVDNRSIK